MSVPTGVPTANVALIFGIDATRKLFSQGSTFENLVKEVATGGQGFVFSTQANPNFISFEHTVNIGKSFEISLSLIDPTAEFEKAFLTNNILDVVAYTYATDGSNSYKINNVGAVDEANLQPVVNNLKSKETVDRATFDLVRDSKRELFLSYGTGNNLNSWAGPFKVEVVNIDIKIDGARILTLKLASTDNHLDPKSRLGAYGEQVDIDPQGLVVVCAGRSNEVKIKDNVIYNPMQIPYARNNIKLPPVIKQLLSLKDIDYHYLIVDTIRNYIQQATSNPNVIVLLPDLNKVCKKIIDKIDYDTRYSTSRSGIPKSFGFLQGGSNAAKARGNYPANSYSLGIRESYLTKLLGEFGLDLEIIHTYAPAPQTITTGIDPAILVGQSKNYIGLNFNSRTTQYYDEHEFFARLTSGSAKGVPDHQVVVGQVIQRINEFCKGEYNIKYDILVENQLQFLDLWKIDPDLLCSKFPLFGGYQDLDPKKEVIIVGDVALIRDFLYGGAKKDKGLAKFLHPLDAAILTNQVYLDRVSDLIKIKDSSFGPASFLPDEFAYIESSNLFTKQERDLISLLGIPVFRYNTQNPNIFELDIKDSSQYFALLKSHFETVLYRKASGVINGIIPSNIANYPIQNINAIVGYATNAGYFNTGLSQQSKKEIIKNITGKFSDDFKNTLVASVVETTQTVDQIIFDAVYLLLESLSDNSNLGLIYQFKQWLSTDPSLVVNDFLNQLYNRAYQLNISTVPFFKISSLSNLTRPCVVLMQSTNMPQTVPEKQTLLNVIYSGIYRIMGYKHVINFNGCHSEFFLQKLLEGKSQQPQPLAKEEFSYPKPGEPPPPPNQFLTVKPPPLLKPPAIINYSSSPNNSCSDPFSNSNSNSIQSVTTPSTGRQTNAQRKVNYVNSLPPQQQEEAKKRLQVGCNSTITRLLNKPLNKWDEKDVEDAERQLEDPAAQDDPRYPELQAKYKELQNILKSTVDTSTVRRSD